MFLRWTMWKEIIIEENYHGNVFYLYVQIKNQTMNLSRGRVINHVIVEKNLLYYKWCIHVKKNFNNNVLFSCIQNYEHYLWRILFNYKLHWNKQYAKKFRNCHCNHWTGIYFFVVNWLSYWLIFTAYIYRVSKPILLEEVELFLYHIIDYISCPPLFRQPIGK